MVGKCSNSERLIRIDERVQVMKEEDIPEIKSDIKEIKNRQFDMRIKLNKDHVRLEALEKAGVGFNIFKIVKMLFRI